MNGIAAIGLGYAGIMIGLGVLALWIGRHDA